MMMLNPQTIGAAMPHGFAGSYARQPDMLVVTAPLAGDKSVPFGAAMKREGSAVLPFGADDTAAQFAGVAARTFKAGGSVQTQGAGEYLPGEAVALFQRGSVQVRCQMGDPVPGGAVYIRTKESESYPDAQVGGFEAEADEGNSVTLTAAQWGGGKDADGVAELVLLTRQNV